MQIRAKAGKTVRRVYAGATFALAMSTTIGLACVDPKGDFQDYVDRTNGVRGGDVGIAEAGDVGPVDLDAGTGTYLVSCLPALLGGDAAKSLLFYADVSLVGGKLDLTMLPLHQDATKFTKTTSQPPPHSVLGIQVSPDGKFTALAGSIQIQRDGQRISDNDWKLKDVTYQGQVLPGKAMCAELQGVMEAPIPGQSFNDPGDYCIFRPFVDGADLPKAKDAAGTEFIGFAASEFHCP
jgi:hypothetical protein